MDIKTQNQLAVALLVLGKIFGVAGLAVGVTTHRMVGGTLLALDGVLLASALLLCLRAMRGQSREEKDHKQVLAQLIREGTLEQFLRDVRESDGAVDVPHARAPSLAPATR